MEKKILQQLGIICLIFILMFLLLQGFEDISISYLNFVEGKREYYALISFSLLVSDILLPIPNSIIMFSNGYVLGFFTGFYISFFGSLANSVVGYFIGKATLKVKPKKLSEEGSIFIEKYGLIGIIISRGIPVLSESISLFSGIHKIQFKAFLISNIIGYIPICFIYSYFGSMGIEDGIFYYALILSFLVSALFWFIGRRFLPSVKKTSRI